MLSATKSRLSVAKAGFTGKTFTQTLFFFLLVTQICFAQWVQTSGPYGGSIITFGANGSTLFTSTYVGVFRSTDSGGWWTQVDLVSPGDPYVVAFGCSATKIFAATVNPGGAFFSTDNGTSWYSVNGLPGFNAMCVSGANLVAGTGDGMFLSTDDGNSWINVDPSIGAKTFAAIGTKLFAGFEAGVFISTDNGTSWAPVNPLPAGYGVNCLAAIDGNLFAGNQANQAGVFRSSDYGTTWTQVNSGLTNTMVGLLAVSGTNLFAGCGDDVFLSTNNGETWTRVNLNLSLMMTYVNCFAVVGSNLFVGIYTALGGPSSAGIWLTTDNGTTWATSNAGLTNGFATSLAIMNTHLFAGTLEQGVFLSTDNGNSWTVTGPANINISCFAISGTNIFAGTWSYGIFLSTNNGTDWIAINAGLPSDSTGYDNIHSIASSGQNLFASTGNSGVYISTNNGTSWTWGNTPFSGFSKMVTLEPYLFAGTDGGVFRSTDNGASWTVVNSGLTDTGVVCLAVNGANLFAGTSSGVFLSTNNGTVWSAASTGLPNTTVRSLTVSGTNLFAETGDVWNYGYGIFLTTNNGTSWNDVSTGLPFTFGYLPNMLVVNDTHIFVEVTNRGVWRRPLSEIIPVELTSFTALANNKEVTLSWSTATELNNQGFEIQRSLLGNEFFTVGFVNGHGTTTEQHNYSYADRNLDDGNYYYRLKQVDYDGSYEYSDVVEVEFRAFNSFLLEQNYPNPFNPTTTIGFGIQNKSNVKITILNAIGEEVAELLNEEKESGYHKVEFSAVNLPSGVYFYQLRAGSYVEMKKMILLK